MKRIYLKNFTYLFLMILLSVSCSKESEGVNTKEPDDDAIEPPVFNEYARNLSIYSGHNRVQLSFESSSDNIEYFVLSWNNKGSKTLTKTINKSEANSGIFKVVVDELIEGDQSFEILAYNKAQKPAKSFRSTRAQVYGANYISSLHNRVIRDMIFIYEKDPVLDWLDARPQEIALEIYYTNETGKLDTIRIPHSEKTTTLPRQLKNTDISYRSLYLPVKTCIDTFYTATSTLPTPIYYASVVTKNFIEKSKLVNEVTSQSSSDIFDGVEYSTLSFIDSSNRPQSSFILMADLSKSHLTINTLMPNNDHTKFALQTVKAMAESRNKVDNKVLAAVNADFYTMSGDNKGKPTGPVVMNGNIVKDYAASNPNYTYFSIKKDGKPHIGLSNSLTQLDYTNIITLVGGGLQRLVTNRSSGTFSGTGVHPRTCIGYTHDNVVYIVVLDGRRSEYSIGMELTDMAKIMHSLGTSEAINLDGGGSSTMVLKEGSSFKIVNRYSDAYPRGVANGLAIMIK